MADGNMSIRNESGLELPRAWLGINDAAKLCRVSRDTIKRRLSAGAFPNARRVAGPGPRGPWEIPQTDLLRAGLLARGRGANDAEANAASLCARLAAAEAEVLALRAHLADLRAMSCVDRCRGRDLG